MKMIDQSCIMKIINGLFAFIKNIFSKSKIIGFLLTNNDSKYEKELSDSIFYKLFDRFIYCVRFLIDKLRLKKYLSNSIFVNPLIWLCVVVVGIPLFPLKALLMVSFISLVSFILKCAVDNTFVIRKNIADYAVLVFILCSTLSILLSNNAFDLWKVNVAIVVFMSNYFVAVNSIRSYKDLKKVLCCFAIVGLFVCLYGIYQYFFGDLSLGVGWIDSSMFTGIDKRMLGTFNNPIFLGEYLIVYSLVCLGLVINTKGIKKIGLLCCFLISCFCVLLTYSRACFLGLIFAIVLLLFFCKRKYLLSFILIILLGLVFAPDSIMNRIFSIGNLNDGSSSHRVAMWDGTLSLLERFWFSGVGYGDDNFLRSITYYSYSYFYIHTEHPHNLILAIFSGMGITGLASFILMMLFYFKKGMSSCVSFVNNSLEKIKKLNIFNVAIMCSFVGLLVVGLFDHTLYKYSIMLLCFIFMGIGVAISNVMEESSYEK